MRVFGLRETIHPSRESIGNCKSFFPLYGRASTSFFTKYVLPLLHDASGTLGGDFDIFAASGESTVWVLLWKTRSRPIGVRLCLVAQSKFFRVWTRVVFWKENSGLHPQLITPESQGGDETNCPSPPSDFQFFDDPDVPFGPQGPPPPEPLAPLGPPGPPGSPGLPPGWPPAPSPASDREGGNRKYVA